MNKPANITVRYSASSDSLLEPTVTRFQVPDDVMHAIILRKSNLTWTILMTYV